MICTFELIASRKYKRQTLKQLTLRKSFVLLFERVDIRKQKSFLSSSRSTSSSRNQRPNAVSRVARVSSWLRASCGPSATNGPTQYQGLRGSAVGYGQAVDRPQPTVQRSIKGCGGQPVVTQKELIPARPQTSLVKGGKPVMMFPVSWNLRMAGDIMQGQRGNKEKTGLGAIRQR